MLEESATSPVPVYFICIRPEHRITGTLAGNMRSRGASTPLCTVREGSWACCSQSKDGDHEWARIEPRPFAQIASSAWDLLVAEAETLQPA